MAEAASASSDTLPKPGRVTEVCREWSVKEDGALAYRLQTEEIEQHYTGNKSRNAQVREDFPHALDEQRREQEEAARLYQQSILEQQELDARVAAELAQQINQEEEARKMTLELEDQRMARKLQEKEHVRVVQKRLPQEINNPLPAFNPDMNCVGLPPPPDPLAPQMRLCSINDITLSPNETVQVVDDNPSRSCESSLCDAEDEETRRIQEEQDAELARLLQERESIPQLSALDRDRLIALEAQDRELARLLQERERAKARRARERAKQRALLKKQQQDGVEAVDELGTAAMPLQMQPMAVRPTHLDLSGASSKSRARMRYTDPEAIEVLSPVCSPSDGSNGTRSSPPPNIAMAIDPTYKGVGSPVSSMISSPLSLPPPDFDDLDDSPVPPYMPIQGQRRCTSLEKKGKKSSLGSGMGSTGRNRKDGGKDGCKQQ